MINVRMLTSILLVLLGFTISETTAAPEVDVIAAALTAQEQAAGRSVQTEYTLENLASPNDSLYRMAVRYIRTPEILFVEEQVERRTSSADPWTLVATSRYRYQKTVNETRSVTTPQPGGTAGNKTTGVIFPGRGSRFGMSEIVETSGYPLVTAPLCEAVKYGTVYEQQEDVDGHPCWKVTVLGSKLPTPISDVDFTLWLDPSISFCPRRVEFIQKQEDGSEKTMTTAFKDYANIGNGVWWPKTVVRSTAPDASASVILKVKAVALDKPVSQEELSVDFPSGTEVLVGHPPVRVEIP